VANEVLGEDLVSHIEIALAPHLPEEAIRDSYLRRFGHVSVLPTG
jgi:hypothetical protein